MRRDESRRARVSTPRVNLNAYYGISDQISVVTAEAGAIFIHGRTGTMSFYHEDAERFGNAYGEAYRGFWTMATPQVAQPMTSFPRTLDLSAYPAATIEHGWFLRA